MLESLRLSRCVAGAWGCYLCYEILQVRMRLNARALRQGEVRCDECGKTQVLAHVKFRQTYMFSRQDNSQDPWYTAVCEACMIANHERR